MKYYATLLNLEAANDLSLEEKDLFEPRLQESLLDRILCGSGETKNEAIQNAIDNLVHESVFEICECESGVKDILTNSPGPYALRHLWLDRDEYHGDAKLHSMPGHDTLVEFCERYKLPQEAQDELGSFIDAILHIHNITD